MSSLHQEPPQNPAGEFRAEPTLTPARRTELIDAIEAAPQLLRAAVAGLDDEQLDAKYRNWTIRQIVHHLADSHLHSYARFKLALTEERPTIKPYDEARWSELPDALAGPVAPSLDLYSGLHGRWTHLLRAMTTDQFARTFYHPESRQTVALHDALQYYAWHARHHMGQITWLREQRGW